MSDTSLAQHERHDVMLIPLIAVGLGLLGAAFFVEARGLSLGLAASGATTLLFAVFSRRVARSPQRRPWQGNDEAITALIEADPSIGLIGDEAGEIVLLNAAARSKLGSTHETVESALSVLVTNPTRVVSRLAARAREAGGAREDLVTRNGHLRLSCTKHGSAGYVWRAEELPAPNAAGAQPLLSAMPMLVVGRNETVLFMNDEARSFLGNRSKTLEQVFPELPIKPDRVQPVRTAEGDIPCVVIEAASSAGRQELMLIPTAQDHVALPENMRFFDELPVPLLKLMPDGEVISANKMARDLLGREEIKGVAISDLLEGLGRSIRDWLQDTVLGRASRQSEFLKVRRADLETFVQVILKPAVEGEQNVLVAVLNDATELKTLELQFAQSQKMQAIGQLAGGVAHDFNNLLTAITGHCDLLMHKRDETDADFADLEQINQNANRAAALVSQLLAFSRKQTLRPEVIDIQDTLSDLTHLLNRLVGERIELEFSHATGDALIRADKRQIEQVVMNLVVNARDAMPTGGTIEIRTELLDLRRTMKRDRAEVPPGQYITVTVRDEGVGIPQDKLQKIFEPFFTTKRTGEGTGLGLSTAYGIVKQTGGFIFADSAPGQGSAFTLIFPMHLEIAQAAMTETQDASGEQAAAVEPLPSPNAVVLLVEDEAPVRAFAARALKLKGFTVVEASCGEEALEILQDESLHIDVFVSDVIMPGMKGPEWVKEALKTRPEVRVVFVSGYAEDVFQEDGPNIEGAAFLQKPFSLVELAEMVQETFEQSGNKAATLPN